jgi:hypothetical protein
VYETAAYWTRVSFKMASHGPLALASTTATGDVPSSDSESSGQVTSREREVVVGVQLAETCMEPEPVNE